MSDNLILVDTNILIYYLNGLEKAQSIIEENNCAISCISTVEILGYNKLEEEKVSTYGARLDSCFYTIDIKEEITNAAVILRRKYGLKTPDSIIAATALAQKVPLVTADKDFLKISEIEVVVFEI